MITGRDQVANSGGVAAEASYVRTLSIGLYFLSNLPMASPCLALPCPCLDHLDLPSSLAYACAYTSPRSQIEHYKQRVAADAGV